MLSFFFLTHLACLVTTSNTFSAESMNFTTVMYTNSDTDNSIASFEHATQDYIPSPLIDCVDDPDWPDPEFCYCYNDPPYPGIDRHWLITAIIWHCERTTGGIGEPMAVYARKDGFYYGGTSTLNYNPIDPTAEPRVAISFFVDKLSEPCKGLEIAVSYDWCWQTLHRPLDWCGVESENGKQGGYIWDNCIYWYVDPSPHSNQPYYGV